MPSMRRPAAIPPDTTDWTFVIDEGCTQCGFFAEDVETTDDRLHAAIPRWREALLRPDAAKRPKPTVWSPLEYACHVRDTCRLFRDRLGLMLREDRTSGSDRAGAASGRCSRCGRSRGSPVRVVSGTWDRAGPYADGRRRRACVP